MCTITGVSSERVNWEDGLMVGIDAAVSYRGDGAYRSPESHVSHETFIMSVRDLATARVRDAQARQLQKAKVVYGKGNGGYRGVTYYEAWHNGGDGADDFIEIAATGEESMMQLAGTTIHELAHILSRSGHDKRWKDAAGALGLTHAVAAGQQYAPEDFDSMLWSAICKLPDPNDGHPAFTRGAGLFWGMPRGGRTRPCPLGIGTRGGTSRGTGSGSRLRLWVCDNPEHPIIRVRVASDTFEASCTLHVPSGICGKAFHKVSHERVETL